MTGPPIENGTVLISGNRITAVGSARELTQHATRNTQLIDLGDCILLPGLINAHCHLDYTNMAGMIPPQKKFTDWIKLITTAKSEWSYTEFAESWLNGADMLLRSGTTTVADFEAVPELLPEVWSAAPLRVLSFLELTGVKSRRDPRLILQDALNRIKAIPRHRSRAAVAPHAPYSTVPELLRLTAKAARKQHWPLSIHVAESEQEFDMIRHRRGEMFDWLQRNERDMTDCGLSSPVAHLERYGVLDQNLIAVHVNYLARNDARLLGERGVSVAHCPRSHHYFSHRAFPFSRLKRAGVNVCLGTDSLATVYKRRQETVELSLFEEMRTFAAANPGVSSRVIVSMATVNGARALGLSGKVGEIAPRAAADLIAIPYAGKARDSYGAVVNHRGDVTAGMIEGEWTIRPSA